MPDIKKILFPVDFSENCISAAQHVKAFGRQFGSDIMLLHVVDNGSYLYPEEVHPHRERDLNAFQVEQFADVQTQTSCVVGWTETIIVETARLWPADLVMMPTHGRGTWRRLLIGSVTAKVLHDAQCPVWTDAHVPERASIPSDVCRRILCAVDTDARDVPVIRWVSEFGKKFGAEIHLVNAVPAVLGPHAQSDRSYREELFKIAQEEMQRLKQEAGVTFDVTIRGGKPEYAVRNTALDLKADLVVIGRGDLQQPFGRLRSHAYAIIRESPCPVISV